MPAGSSSKVRVFLTIALAAACVVFTLRGPAAAVGPGGNYDFTLIYSSSRAWFEGQNPYQVSGVSKAWMSSGGSAELDPTLVRGDATLVYPLPALVILSPIAALPWPVATWVWAILNTVFVAASLTALARIAGLIGAARLAFLTLGLLFAPLALNAKQGQTAVVVLACVAFAARTRRVALVSGFLSGIGAALKPQLGLLFVVYEAGRLRWKHALIAAAAIGALTAIGAARMSIVNVDWWNSWRGNVKAFTTLDDANATKSNPIRYQMINLHYPLHNLTDNREVVRVAVYAITGALCLAYFIVDRRRRVGTDQPAELTSLSFVTAITLMVAYHRPYDASVLVIPLVLAIQRIAIQLSQDRQLAPNPAPTMEASSLSRHWVTLALVLIHALPLQILFTELARRNIIPASIYDSAIGQYILLPCQAYGLVVLAGWLIWVRWKDPSTQRST